MKISIRKKNKYVEILKWNPHMTFFVSSFSSEIDMWTLYCSQMFTEIRTSHLWTISAPMSYFTDTSSPPLLLPDSVLPGSSAQSHHPPVSQPASDAPIYPDRTTLVTPIRPSASVCVGRLASVSFQLWRETDKWLQIMAHTTRVHKKFWILWTLLSRQLRVTNSLLPDEVRRKPSRMTA